MRTAIYFFLVCLILSCQSKKPGIDLELIPVSDEEGSWGYIDHKGKPAFKSRFREAHAFAEGRALVRSEEGLFGFINKEGAFEIKPRFVAAQGFSEGLAAVTEKDSGIVYINREGTIVFRLPAVFDGAGEFNEGLAMVRKAGKYGYINDKGSLVVEPVWEEAHPFTDGLAIVGRREGKGTNLLYGAIDTRGEIIIEPKYRTLLAFKEGLAPFIRERNFGFVNKAGEIVIKEAYEDVQSFSDGLAPVRKEGKWGYIDVKGNMVIRPKYEGAYIFSEGLAAVQREGSEEWGFIDKEGALKIPSEHAYVSLFVDGIAFVSNGKKVGLIDREGRALVQPSFISASAQRGGSFINSDYFDPASFARLIFKNAEPQLYKGLGAASSFDTARKLYPSINYNNYNFFYTTDPSPTTRHLQLSTITLHMGDDFGTPLYTEPMPPSTAEGEIDLSATYYGAPYNDAALVKGVTYSFLFIDKGKAHAADALRLIREHRPPSFKVVKEEGKMMLLSNGYYSLQITAGEDGIVVRRGK